MNPYGVPVYPPGGGFPRSFPPPPPVSFGTFPPPHSIVPPPPGINMAASGPFLPSMGRPSGLQSGQTSEVVAAAPPKALEQMTTVYVGKIPPGVEDDFVRKLLEEVNMQLIL